MDDFINVWTGGNFRNRFRDANGATIIVADDTDDPKEVIRRQDVGRRQIVKVNEALSGNEGTIGIGMYDDFGIKGKDGNFVDLGGNRKMKGIPFVCWRRSSGRILLDLGEIENRGGQGIWQTWGGLCDFEDDLFGGTGTEEIVLSRVADTRARAGCITENIVNKLTIYK